MEPETQELFSCGDCPKTFIKRRDYNKHRKHHDRPHACSLCARTFGLKTDLERHRKIHRNWETGKDFYCKFPGCKFQGTRRKDYLWTHIKKTHNSKDSHLDKSLRAFFEEFTSGGETPQIELDLGLLEAANVGDTEKILDLLSRGADTSTMNSNCKTPLDLAIAKNYGSVVKILCDHVVDATSVMENAVKSGEGEVVKFLMENGIDTTSVMESAVRLHEEEVVKFLIENGARINSLGSGRGQFYQAVLNGDANYVTLLLQRGADFNERDFRAPFGTALHRAVLKYEAITRILLKAGADFEAKDGNGRTPLDYSTSRFLGQDFIGYIYNEATTKLLLEAGASIENCFWYKYPLWVEMMTKFMSTCTLPSPQPSQVNDNTTALQELIDRENSVVLGMRDRN